MTKDIAPTILVRDDGKIMIVEDTGRSDSRFIIVDDLSKLECLNRQPKHSVGETM